MNRTKGAGRGQLIRMGVSEGFASFVLDQLGELGGVTARSMFGGKGLYCDGVFFAILAADVLYFKVDNSNRPDYEKAGSQPFRPYAHRLMTMKYWAVPLDVLESPLELVAWARKAVAVARRASAG